LSISVQFSNVTRLKMLVRIERVSNKALKHRLHMGRVSLHCWCSVFWLLVVKSKIMFRVDWGCNAFRSPSSYKISYHQSVPSVLFFDAFTSLMVCSLYFCFFYSSVYGNVCAATNNKLSLNVFMLSIFSFIQQFPQ
jgi:hypothetical protein